MRHREFKWTAQDGTRLFAQSWEPEDRQEGVIALVHGLGDHSARYTELAGHFVDAGFRVVGFDQRGHGRTGGKQGYVRDYELLLDDVSVLLTEAVREGEQKSAFLYGHSLGGNIVLNYVLRRQPSLCGVVATSPLLRPAFSPPAWQKHLARLLARVFPRYAFQLPFNPSMLAADPESVQQYTQDPLVHQRVSPRLALQMLEAGEWAWRHADRLSIPLLLMHGGADCVTSPQGSRGFAVRAGSACTLRIWDGLRHELHKERERDTVAQYMIDFLHNTLSQGVKDDD